MILAETFYLFDVDVANDLRQALRGGVLGTRAPLDPQENRSAPVAALSRAAMARRVMLIRPVERSAERLSERGKSTVLNNSTGWLDRVAQLARHCAVLKK